MGTSKPINLHLYPCLNYISKHGNRSDMAKVYDLLTRGRGLSLIEACNHSDKLANEYGYFGGIPFTPDEILHFGKCFKDRTKGQNPCAMIQMIASDLHLDIEAECCAKCKYMDDFKWISFEEFIEMNSPESSDDKFPFL